MKPLLWPVTWNIVKLPSGSLNMLEVCLNLDFVSLTFLCIHQECHSSASCMEKKYNNKNVTRPAFNASANFGAVATVTRPQASSKLSGTGGTDSALDSVVRDVKMIRTSSYQLGMSTN